MKNLSVMRRVVYSVLLLFTLLNLNSNVISAAQALRSKFLGCGAHNLSPGEYWIESPRRMNQFKKAYNCQFSLKVAPENIISISCPHFSTSSRWCKKNYLQIQRKKYCGFYQTPEDVSPRGHLKIAAFSRGHPEKIKFLCQILVSRGRIAVSTNIPVASTSISTVVTALSQAPKTAASKSTVSAPVPTTSSTAVSVTTAAPTSTIVPATSTLETTASSGAASSSTTVSQTTAAATSTIQQEASTSGATFNSSATGSSSNVPETTTAPTSTIVPASSASETTVSSAATTTSTTIPETTAAPTSYIVSETSTFETTVSSTATPSLTTGTTTVSTTTPPCQPQPPAPVKCGMTNNRKTRIVGGEAAERNEFPWLAAVVRTGSSGAQWVATILNSLYVILPSTYLTATRIIDKHEVVVHKHFTSADKQQIRIKIKSAVKNSGVMLLKLRTPIVFPANNSIAPVCLPAEDRTDYAGEQGIIAGWGWTKRNVWSSPYSLMKLTVTVAPDAECKAKFEQLYKYAQFNATTKLCTVSVKGKGACSYDSGAPLITADNDGKYSIIGISQVVNCGDTDYPDFYYKVTGYLPWIRRQIADGEYCTKP